MGRVAMVTGGSRGLGFTLATFLAGRGYDLILTARDATRLESSAEVIRAGGARVIAIAGDVADAGHRLRLIDAAEERGRLDLLVNNASTLGATPLPGLAEYPLDMLTRVFQVNVVAPLALIQAALPLLRRTPGTVVNLSSDAARGAYPGWGGYGASKAALDLASRTLAKELAEAGIAVVAVDPGDLRTRMHQAAFPGEDISDRPLPEVTLPFWAWLLGQEPAALTGRRYQAQGDVWEVTG